MKDLKENKLWIDNLKRMWKTHKNKEESTEKKVNSSDNGEAKPSCVDKKAEDEKNRKKEKRKAEEKEKRLKRKIEIIEEREAQRKRDAELRRILKEKKELAKLSKKAEQKEKSKQKRLEKIKKQQAKRKFKSSTMSEQDKRIRRSLTDPKDLEIYIKYTRYKTRCKKLNRDFYLSFYEFRYFITKPCVYCGTLEGITIDRVDSSEGYNPYNVDPCCLWCNQMKNKYSKEQFLNQIKRVHDRHFKPHFL